MTSAGCLNYRCRTPVGDKGIRFYLSKLFFRAANAPPPLKRPVFANFGED
jgi:hypothetical protein